MNMFYAAQSTQSDQSVDRVWTCLWKSRKPSSPHALKTFTWATDYFYELIENITKLKIKPSFNKSNLPNVNFVELKILYGNQNLNKQI